MRLWLFTTLFFLRIRQSSNFHLDRIKFTRCCLVVTSWSWSTWFGSSTNEEQIIIMRFMCDKVQSTHQVDRRAEHDESNDENCVMLSLALSMECEEISLWLRQVVHGELRGLSTVGHATTEKSWNEKRKIVYILHIVGNFHWILLSAAGCYATKRKIEDLMELPMVARWNVNHIVI